MQHAGLNGAAFYYSLLIHLLNPMFMNLQTRDWKIVF